MKRNSIIVAMAGLGLTAAGLTAAPELISQNRYVRATFVEIEAQGFGLFDESVSHADDAEGFPCIPSRDGASQESEITTSGFFANGECDESIGTCRLPGDERGFGPPTLFEFDFAVTVETTLALSGTLTTGITGFDPPGVASGSASLMVSGSEGIVAEWQTGGIDQLLVSFDEELVLSPGTYTVRAHAFADPFVQDSGFGRFNVVGTFSSGTCGADLNNDEILDLADVQLFVSAFMAAQPPADIDGNGVYDLADVQGFVSSFNAGCP